MKRPFAIMLAGVLLAGCLDGSPIFDRAPPLERPVPDRDYLKDSHGRYLFFHGVNVAGSTKLPFAIGQNGVPNYVGRPFPLEEAEARLAQIRSLGFDAIRLLLIWEAIEPTGRGQYDEAYLDYIREIVRAAGRHGIMVLLDMHQDMFSRHLVVRYNNKPKYGNPGEIGYMLQALVPDPDTGQYNDTVQGDGAPRWAVQACLPEKNMASPRWGIPRILSGLDQPAVDNLIALFDKLSGSGGGGPAPDWIGAFVTGLPGKFPMNETCDVLPFTNWGLAMTLSLDVARAFGCFFAGDALFPQITVEGQSVKDYLQDAYAAAFARVAEKVADLPNVLGYDLMNEPSGNFIVLAALGGLMQAGAASGAHDVLVSLLGPETGELLFRAILDLRLLPPDTSEETLREFGVYGMDILTALTMNFGFSDNYLRPFYERVGRAILEKDPDATIFIENALGIEMLLAGLGGANGGLAGMWEQPMTRPAGIPRLVFAPHWYADIYPFFGFNMMPREFAPEEVRYRDYRPSLEGARALSDYALGKVPVVFGEFGTYFNFNGGAEASEAQQYAVSAHILDNYFEAFEGMFQSRIMWCYTPDNDPERGDGWNHEDFSIVDWHVSGDLRGVPRAEAAWSRPHARALAGKPVSTHYYSPLHYFDPEKGRENPVGEFEVRYTSKESRAPSEIVVPPGVYPDGFYVWVSDGACAYDPESATLFHWPSRDEPGAEHWLRIRPPLPGEPARGWKYFFHGDRALEAR